MTTSQCPDWARKHSISLAATSWPLSAPQKLTEQNRRASGKMRRKVRTTVGPPNSTCSPQVLKGALLKCSTFCLMTTSGASQRNGVVPNIPCRPISGSAKLSLSFIFRAVGQDVLNTVVCGLSRWKCVFWKVSTCSGKP